MPTAESQNVSDEFPYCGHLFASLPLGIVIQDAGGAVTHANGAAERILGRLLDEMRGTMFIDPHWRPVREDGSPFHGVDHPAMVALKTGIAQPERIMGVYHPNADTPTWISVSATPIWSSARDAVLAVYSVLQDVTNRRNVETSLHEQQLLYRVAIETSMDAIIGISLDGTVASWNPAAEAIFGYSAAEMTGQPMLRMFPPSLYAQEADILTRIRRGETAHHLETVRLRKDGTEIHVSVTESPIHDAHRTVIGVCKIARDITERVRNDRIQGARLRLMTCAVSHTLKELLVATLDEAGELTDSPIGFYHFLEADQKTLSLQAWSTQTTRAYCTAAGEGSHYNIDEAGVWVECIRLRQPVIHNDYASLPNKRGLPPGHAPLIRELVVPVFRSGLIVALLGVGNKASNYSQRDLETITLLADLAWDFAESKRAHDALRESEERFRQAMDATRDGVWDLNMATDTNYFSPAWYRMLGYEPGEFAATSAHWASLIHPEDHDRVLACNNECIDNLRPDFEVEYRMRTKQGEWKWLLSRGKAASRDAQGRALRMVGTHFDITERKETELQINFLAYHDQLTALPNRTLFFDRFSQAISFAKRGDQRVALLFLDLDGFKPVNDLYGHDAGDAVLKIVADRLQNAVRAMDTVARLGGDEFAVVLGQLEDPAEAGVVGGKLLAAVAQPITLNDQTTVSVAASIGVSVYPDNGNEMDVLLAQADSAMYESKDQGRNRLTFWSGVNVQKAADAVWIQMGDEHLVGFKEMDDQHRELVRLVNELNAVIHAKGDSADIARRFTDLVEFTKFHFATEHQFMERYRFPGKKAHDLAHGRLLMDISHFNAMLNRGGDLFVLQSIKDWLLHHIQAEDKKLGEFLSQQALT